MKERVFYVDEFRGLAILLMVFLNIFDYLSVYDVHVDAPFYVKGINSVTLLPPILLFCFVSGMSAYFISTKFSNVKDMIVKSVKKYGKYFLISIPFTMFMWGFRTFYEWEEAIQGITVSAVIASILIHYLKKKDKFMEASFLIYITQAILLFSWRNGWTAGIPFNTGYSIIGFFLNMLFRGWFSILNLVPIMLMGAFFLKNYVDNKLRINLIISLMSGLIAVILYPLIPVDYYMRSLNLFFYFTSICGFITVIIYYLNQKNIKFRFLRVFGLLSFEIYITHFLLAKSFRLMGFGDSLAMIPTAIITILIIFLYYLFANFYARKFKKELLK